MWLVKQTRRHLAPCLFLSLVLISVPASAVERRGEKPQGTSTINAVIQPDLKVNPVANTTSDPVPPTSITLDPLKDILRLAKSGANQLALQRMDALQPQPEQAPEEWLRWERQRITLYQKTKNWTGLTERVTAHQQFISSESKPWFIEQQIDAWLELGRGKLARRGLRQLLWTADEIQNLDNIAGWQTRIIRSYLLDGQANAAHTAMLRYAQDYANINKQSDDYSIGNDVLLRARVLLQAMRPADALEVLRGKKTAAAKSLILLASLRHTSLSAAEVIAEVNKLLANKKLEKQLRLRLVSILAEASKIKGDNAGVVTAFEMLLAGTRQRKIDDGLFEIGGEQLWQAYITHAQVIGNAEQLLIGDDTSWLIKAGQLSNRPVAQRSLYGFLSLRATDEATRKTAAEQLVTALQKQNNGVEILRGLYLQESSFVSKGNLPDIVRYTLLEQALKESDIKLASTLMIDLSAAPKGIQPVMWELRRARVFVMAGKPAQAQTVLDDVLKSDAELDKLTTDRLIQVLFDLQTVGEHESAYKLFKRLLQKVKTPQVKRELLYWMADSRKAEKRYAEAAALYLRSAEKPDEPTIDLWAQSALYQAAENLALAGLINDARTLYMQLLTYTKDASRQAQLQRRLQQLWLHGKVN